MKKTKLLQSVSKQYKNDDFGGAVEICSGRYKNLHISWDYDGDIYDKNNRTAVLLWIPDTKKHDHEHIEMNREQAQILKEWLDEYLKDI